MGSVKDLEIKKPATEKETGIGVFTFTDDYSVFDYGKMPDIIPCKGEALCRMASYNFQELEKLGIKSHFRGLVSGSKMEVDLVRVLYPQKGELRQGMRNYLVPLEVIYRNSLPEGSSVFKRIDSGELDWKSLGLKKKPVPGEKLSEPIMDVSTKLEATDRYLSWEEARKISVLDEKQIGELKKTALKINTFLNKRAKKIGLEHADGKVEFGISPDGKLILLDVAGTLDEDRFLFNGFHISKQVLRDYYKKTPWYAIIEREKAEGKGKGNYTVPPGLPKELVEIVSDMYKSVCEAWIEKKVWNAPHIESIVESYKGFMEKQG
ncbi:MAG: phosphoribosylaminoimidazolesuccinocarboxamide synthase [Candidatus ainarchaeum sp.]|nr:phosphoribosylaminoimidazolesuccinocarboxamide synthase [Candidatus ainarchaeum sp.]